MIFSRSNKGVPSLLKNEEWGLLNPSLDKSALDYISGTMIEPHNSPKVSLKKNIFGYSYPPSEYSIRCFTPNI